MGGLQKLQLCGLEILKKFREICSNSNLTYYLSGGTLLGTVRKESVLTLNGLNRF